jgi:hypothetical protein
MEAVAWGLLDGDTVCGIVELPGSVDHLRQAAGGVLDQHIG